MGRPKGITGIKARKWMFEDKMKIVQEHLEKHKGYVELETKYHVNRGVIHNWIKRYLEEGEEGLKRKRGKTPPEMGLYHKKELTETEALQLEIFKLRIENARLKKGYTVKGVGSNKEYVPTSKTNIKSSKT